LRQAVEKNETPGLNPPPDVDNLREGVRDRNGHKWYNTL
jgi:hypothetical protein